MLILSNKFASCSIYCQRCVIHRRASLLDTNEQKEKNQFVLPSQNFVIVRRLEALEVIRYKSQGIRNSVIKIIMKMLIKFHIVQDYFRNGRPVNFRRRYFFSPFFYFIYSMKSFKIIRWPTNLNICMENNKCLQIIIFGVKCYFSYY